MSSRFHNSSSSGSLHPTRCRLLRTVGIGYTTPSTSHKAIKRLSSVTMTTEEENPYKNKYSVELPDTSTSDRGGIRRGDVLTHPELGVDGVQTLYEGLRRGLALNPLGPCLGFRAMSSSGFPTPFIYSSYTECVARVDAFAAGLDCLDLVEPNPDGMILVRIILLDYQRIVIVVFFLLAHLVPLISSDCT